MAIKGRNNAGAYVDASVVYGYDSVGVKQYAKQASVRNSTNTGWDRAWTDCRQHDAPGGRDWTPSPVTTGTGCNDCGTKVVTTYTKTGCTSYERSTSCTGTQIPQTDPEIPPCDGQLFCFSYFYQGPAGYYNKFEYSESCQQGNPNSTCSFRVNSYYITKCNITNEYKYTLLSLGQCINGSGEPC